MEEEKPNQDLNKEIQELPGWKKFLFVIGGLCFIVAATFVFIHLGFIVDNHTSSNHQPKLFLTRENLWIVNLCLGAFGGAILGYKHMLIGALSGLLASAAITGTTLLYLSWRDTVYMAELILPMMTGLVGIGVYQSLKKNRS